MNFDQLLRYKALGFLHTASNTALTDMLADNAVEHNVPMKNVCAMITQELFDDLNQTCSLLDISKRSFIEAAIIEALAKADKVMEEEGVHSYLSDLAERQAADKAA
jgi:hypothetical protein